MRIIRRREDEDTARLIRTLRDQVAEAQAETAVQVRANGRLAASAGTAEQALAVEAASIRDARTELVELCDRQQAKIGRWQTAYRGLRRQLDDALGYNPDALCPVGELHDWEALDRDRQRCTR